MHFHNNSFIQYILILFRELESSSNFYRDSRATILHTNNFNPATNDILRGETQITASLPFIQGGLPHYLH